MKLIRYGNLIINTSQLLEAIYGAASSDTEAELILLYAGAESEARTNYDCDYIGEQSKLYTRKITGEMAEGVWRKLERACEEQLSCTYGGACAARGGG